MSQLNSSEQVQQTKSYSQSLVTNDVMMKPLTMLRITESEN